MIHNWIFCSFPLNSFLIYNVYVYFFVLSRHKRDTVGHHGSCGLDKYKEWMTASAQPASNDGVRTQLFSYYQKKIQFLFCLTKLHAEDLVCLINWVKQINDVKLPILSQIDVHDDVTKDNIYSQDSNTEFNRHKRAPVSCYSKPARTCNLYLRADPVLFNETRNRLGVRMRPDYFSRFKW